MNRRKLYLKALNNPKGLRFAEALALAEAFGFLPAGGAGSHHAYTHPDDPRARLNIQADKNRLAKAYQVRQLLTAVEEHGLQLEDEE